MNEDAFLRGILSVHRGDEPEAADPRFAEVRRHAEANEHLAQWWERDKVLDRAIAAKLANVRIPADLKTRLTAEPKISAPFRSSWARTALLAAACLVALGVLFGSWRGPFQPAASLADYRDEMVGFIKIDPSLEMKSPQLMNLTNWLQRNHAPSHLVLPGKLRGLDAIGCRTLRFRGHDVALICFRQKDGNVLHLFVVNRGALPGVRKSDVPQLAPQGDWMTGVWGEGDQIYLITARADEQTIESYLNDT